MCIYYTEIATDTDIGIDIYRENDFKELTYEIMEVDKSLIGYLQGATQENH